MKKLIVILTAISIFSCSKSDEMNPQVILDAGFTFSVYNSQNEDLFDLETLNHFEATEIKLFYEVDGEIIEINDPNMDYPRNFMLYKADNENRIRISMNHSETSEKPITYIQWNNSDTDTIEVVYERINKSIFKRKVWLNGQEIWDWTKDDSSYYKITKDMP